MPDIGIVGPGRVGTGLGLAFLRRGISVRLHGRHPQDIPDSLPFSWGGVPKWINQIDVLLLAVPDDAIKNVASSYATGTGLTARHVVLHLSGALDVTALESLRPTGAALGSLHPIQSLSDPSSAPERLDGAIAGVEGDDRAVAMAGELSLIVGLTPVRIATPAKGLYHAAAVFASNYLVAILATASRLFESSGMPPHHVREALASLVTGTLENVVSGDPAAALTGPIARGDVETIRMHLNALSEKDASLYRSLGRAALDVSKLVGEPRIAVQRVLGFGEGSVKP